MSPSIVIDLPPGGVMIIIYRSFVARLVLLLLLAEKSLPPDADAPEAAGD
jgi:hypothetical protein